MHYLMRMWVALAVLGAALVHLAVAAGTSLPLLLVFTAVGVAELTWATLTLAKRRYVLQRAIPLLLLLPLAVWAVAVFVGTSAESLPGISLVGASLLDVVAAVAIAIHSRRTRSGDEADEREPSAGRLILGLTAGAFVMAAVALPALGQTPAGIAASTGPHSHHGTVELDLDHEGH